MTETATHLACSVLGIKLFSPPPFSLFHTHRTHAHIHTHTHTCTHMHTCTHAHVHTCTCAHTHTCTQGMMERVGMYIIHQNFCDGEDLARGRPGEVIIDCCMVSFTKVQPPSPPLPATSSSSHAEHDPGEAVDGLLTEETCFWSAPDDSHWWMVDLGADLAISKIRITNTVSWGPIRLTIC